MVGRAIGLAGAVVGADGAAIARPGKTPVNP